MDRGRSIASMDLALAFTFAGSIIAWSPKARA
jgi:hypothetical protein